ncbi:MAG TPA: limonene-1,2-epoxide hydrolase family protein [Acidimicrobiales bacterium]|nr:limonene-1,2-epoxide hydrolase family protein [Acidimicrobiales bacterium]
MGTNAEQIVLWVTSWPELGLPPAAADFFTADARYENVPVQGSEVRGAVAIGETLVKFRSMFERIEVEVVAVAEEGDLVMVERIERYVLLDGVTLEIDVIGAFELRDGLIGAWRDYWEVAPTPVLAATTTV